ncbi:TPA: hypothetical protein HA278_06405 [Candidatus Woesearchaeota archaeon]|nr:hypothetical protein [Candidatus Woesearchaeota archaeon]
MSAEKMYKLQDSKGWEIYFRPLTDDSIEVITFYQGDPHINPRKVAENHHRPGKDNVEVWSVIDARHNWNIWCDNGFERAEVEDYLEGGRSKWEGEHINYRKSINTTKENVTMNGKPSSVADISKALKGMMAE